jgi:SAM-dependent methyltransferase
VAVTVETVLLERFYPETAFGGFTRVDGTMAFYLRVNALLHPASVVLDVGCGRGEYAEDPVPDRRSLRTVRGKCAKVIGIDADEAATQNPFLDEFRLVTGLPWPVGDSSVGLCLVDNVLEHVARPDLFFAECSRVVEPGGYVCIRTPNLCAYSTALARLIPNRLHAHLLGWVQPDRRPEDVFATYYRCNTQRRLSAALARHGFEAVVLTHGGEPAYLGFSPTAYAAGVLWASKGPANLQSTLFAFGCRVAPRDGTRPERGETRLHRFSHRPGRHPV